MESDTEKKKGRPQTIAGIMSRIYKKDNILDTGERAAINYYYAIRFLNGCYGELESGSFFLSANRKVRRQGIAEQLGRMLEADLISTEQAEELAQQAIDDYNSGRSVKEITNTLRLYRQHLESISKGSGYEPDRRETQ